MKRISHYSMNRILQARGSELHSNLVKHAKANDWLGLWFNDNAAGLVMWHLKRIRQAGMGDTVAAVTHALRIDCAATWLAKRMGKTSCGCVTRQKWLNWLVPYDRRAWVRRGKTLLDRLSKMRHTGRAVIVC